MSELDWGEWMEAQGLTWDEVVKDLENAPKAQALIKQASKNFMEGREDTVGLAEFVGILAGDV